MNTTDSRISMMDPQIQECPFEAHDYLLENAPIYLDPITGFFVVTRYDDLRQILTDPTTFASGGFLERIRHLVKAERAEQAREMYEQKGWIPGPTLSMMDNPRHREVRRVFDNAFRAGKIKELEPIVRRAAYDLVEALPASGECDILQQFAIPFPLIVIGVQMMGAKKEDIWLIKKWTEAYVQRLSFMLTDEEELHAVELDIEGQHYFKPILDRLREEPDQTVLSEIVNTTLSDGSKLTDNELFAHMMADTFVGGSETTTNALAEGIKILAENPNIFAQLKSRPEQYLKTFIEEVLRLQSPVQGLFRVAQKDVELHGVSIPAGSVLNMRFSAANRDARHFAFPHSIDLERGNAGSHLAFGSGIHHCLGAPLARRELHWGFTALLDNIQSIRLTPGKNDFRHFPSIMLRALTALHIEFERRH